MQDLLAPIAANQRRAAVSPESERKQAPTEILWRPSEPNKSPTRPASATETEAVAGRAHIPGCSQIETSVQRLQANGHCIEVSEPGEPAKGPGMLAFSPHLQFPAFLPPTPPFNDKADPPSAPRKADALENVLLHRRRVRD